MKTDYEFVQLNVWPSLFYRLTILQGKANNKYTIYSPEKQKYGRKFQLPNCLMRPLARIYCYQYDLRVVAQGRREVILLHTATLEVYFYVEV